MERKLGNYLLGTQIEAGGMAEIRHAAIQGAGTFEKEICIKLIRAEYADDPEFKRMFENEAVIAGKLQHANVVQVFDYNHVDNRYYIAMEYVFGKDLRKALNRAAEYREPVGWALAARICHDAAAGLGAAHRFCGPGGQPNPIIHRDVSPHNILLSFAGEVKIADFGIARLRKTDQRTKTGVLKGKVSYMSPEQASGTHIDVRSDVFSLGIVLWEMLTGLRLFEGDSEMAIMQRVKEAIILPPSSAGKLVPRELDAIVMKALECDPAARYADGAEMADALKKFLYALTHNVDEESVAAFLARLYPDEKRPEVRNRTQVMLPDGPEAPATPAPEPVPAGPAENTSTEPDVLTRRRKVLSSAAMTAATIVIVTLAGWYFTRPAPPPAAPVATVLPAAAPSPAPQAAPKTAPVVCAPAGGTESCADPAPAKLAPAVDPPPEPARKSAAAQAKPAARTGRLTLNANPWADIYLKGKKIGTTPLTNHPLPEGTHKIVLKNPELNAQKEITIRIAADELTTVPVDLLAR